MPSSGSSMSVSPSQSLSRPSQTSGDGPVLPMQNGAPSLHTYVPATHSPSSVPQPTPMRVSATCVSSSTLPSQSSSRKLHSSPTVGNTGQGYSQPFAGLPSRFVKPVSHLVPSSVHWPSTHTPPFAAWFGAQRKPQPPQLLGSVLKSTFSSILLSQSLSTRSHRLSSSALLVQ